jgi:hypothetical protein
LLLEGLPHAELCSGSIGGRRLRAVPIRGLITGDDVKAFYGAQEKANTNNEVAVVAGSPVQRMLQDGAGQQSSLVSRSGLQGINGVHPAVARMTQWDRFIVAVVILILMAADAVSVLLLHQTQKQEEIKDRSMNNTITSNTAATAVSKITDEPALCILRPVRPAR